MTSPPAPGADVADLRFAEIAGEALRSTLDRDPVEATYLGDHERDALLPDPSADAAAVRLRQLRTLLAEIDALPEADPDGAVDAAVLRTALAAEMFDLETVREAEWNPMLHNPGGALHALLTREFAPVDRRLESAVGRLSAVPDYLAAARKRLGEMSAVHLRTACLQLDGTLGLLDTALPPAAGQVPALRSAVESAAGAARTALIEHRAWLADRLPSAKRDSRLGKDLFAAKLALTLDTPFAAEQLLRRAEADLAETEQRIAEEAARLTRKPHAGRDAVRDVLTALARDAPTDVTVLDDCSAALLEATAFVRAHELVTVHDDPIAIVAMPEIDRGVAVAYCRPNGPLETADLPTEIAVSPTPDGWDTERVASFYREYNRHLLHGLMVHEAMPGHALQLMHANRSGGRTPVRRVWSSGTFVEGWAVYTEQLMADAGYRSDVSPDAAAAVRMQHLKMRLRTVINTILDIRFHCDDLDEAAALDLMRRRGFQEDGEAAGKWQRVQLTSTQLCTYFVGFLEVGAAATDLRAAHPNWSERRRHDALLAHGSPPPRHLRTLLGLAAGG